MGMNPLLSSERSEDEGLFVRQHEFWAQIMLDGMAREAVTPMMEAAE
jgi:benzoate/toluate 1,2-dioxygenase alpha subunit